MQRSIYNAAGMLQNKSWWVVSLNKNIYKACLGGRIRKVVNYFFQLQQPFKYSDNFSPEMLDIYIVPQVTSELCFRPAAFRLLAFRLACLLKRRCSHPWLSLCSEGTGRSFCSELLGADAPDVVTVLTIGQTVESFKVSSCRSDTSYFFHPRLMLRHLI